MLAAHVEGAILWVYPDRTSLEVARFDVPEGFYISRADILARRDGVAAFALVTPNDGDEGRAYVDVMVLDLGGESRVRTAIPFPHNGAGEEFGVVGRQDGLFMFHFNDTERAKVLVVEGGEIREHDAPVAARRDPDAQGNVMVLDVRGSGSADYNFFDATSGVTSRSLYVADPTLQPASSPHLLAGGMLYLAHSPSRWIYEDASGIIERPIDVVLNAPEHATPAWQSSGERALFALGGTSPATTRYLTVDFRTGSTREFTLSPPEGYALPEAYWNPPAIDASGRLVMTMASADRLQLFATSDGETWQTIGQPLGLDTYFDLFVAGQTVVLKGRGGSSQSTPGTLPSWSMQLVGADGVGAELIRWEPGTPENPLEGDPELSSDGACLAYFRGGSLHVAEVDGYRTDDVGIEAGIYGRADMSWIPLDSPPPSPE